MDRPAIGSRKCGIYHQLLTTIRLNDACIAVELLGSRSALRPSNLVATLILFFALITANAISENSKSVINSSLVSCPGLKDRHSDYFVATVVFEMPSKNRVVPDFVEDLGVRERIESGTEPLGEFDLACFFIGLALPLGLGLVGDALVSLGCLGPQRFRGNDSLGRPNSGFQKVVQGPRWPRELGPIHPHSCDRVEDLLRVAIGELVGPERPRLAENRLEPALHVGPWGALHLRNVVVRRSRLGPANHPGSIDHDRAVIEPVIHRIKNFLIRRRRVFARAS